MVIQFWLKWMQHMKYTKLNSLRNFVTIEYQNNPKAHNYLSEILLGSKNPLHKSYAFHLKKSKFWLQLIMYKLFKRSSFFNFILYVMVLWAFQPFFLFTKDSCIVWTYLFVCSFLISKVASFLGQSPSSWPVIWITRYAMEPTQVSYELMTKWFINDDVLKDLKYVIE